jgi:hypothetical protein
MVSKISRPSGEGCTSHRLRSFCKSSGVRHSVIAVAVSAGTTLFQRNTHARHRTTVKPMIEVNPSRP